MDNARTDGGHTIDKRKLWGGLRNPTVRQMVRDGETSPSADLGNYTTRSVTEDMGFYRRREYAYLESLVYYFDEGWFDLDNDKRLSTSDGIVKTKRVRSQPYRCPECRDAWQDGDREIGGVDVLPPSVWFNVRMKSKLCKRCDA